MQETVRALKRALPDLVVMTDVCLCEYTSHGLRHRRWRGDPERCDRRAPRARHCRMPLPGADFVAPSDMMDGRVAAIRRTLDEGGF